MNINRTRPYIIGIAGSSGSGKTEFIRSFSETFQPHEITLVSQDNYYIRVHNQTKKENKLHNFDLPSAINREAFFNDIESLIKGETISQEEYNFNNPLKTTQLLTVKPAPILVIEGLFIYHYQEINELLDHRIFLHADDEIALNRRIKRDALERGYDREEVTYKWHHHVVPAYEKYLKPYKNICNQLIENNGHNLSDIQQSAKTISTYIRQFFF